MGEQRKQLITVDQFRELARPTSTHLDEDEVNAYIRECEDANIIPAIGWKRFKAATEQGEWGDSVLPDFQPATSWTVANTPPRRRAIAAKTKPRCRSTPAEYARHSLISRMRGFFVPMAQL